MSFNMPTSGAGWRLAGSLIQLGSEIRAAYPQATCLGTVGDTEHEAEGDLSDHNPIVRDPHTGVGIVRAIDIGGSNSMLQSIRQRIWTLYAEQDPRLWLYGYAKGTSDNLVNGFGLPFKTHVDDGDAGHLHISVTQSHYPSIPSGYVPAIDSTARWGFGASLLGGGTPVTAPPKPSSDSDEDDMVGWYVSDGAGHTYVVDHNLKSKLHLPDAASDAAIRALTAAMPTYNTTPAGATGPGRGFVTVVWPPTLLAAIPDVVAGS